MKDEKLTLRDKFWLWGHPEGRYNFMWGNDKVSRMTPMEGCSYLGVRNTFMVPCDVGVERRKYNKSFRSLRNVAWECYAAAFDPEKVEANITDAKDFPNITGVVFDDFVRGGLFRQIPIENLWKVRERLHNNEVRPLDMWMVLYTREFGLDPAFDAEFARYIEPFDGVAMWTWEEKDVPLIPEKFEIFKKLTPKQRRLCGCYLWNFGESKEATGEAVRWQLDWYREKIYEGEIEGVILHTNTMADLDYEAYDVACAWMDEHGDEPYPEK